MSGRAGRGGRLRFTAAEDAAEKVEQRVGGRRVRATRGRGVVRTERRRAWTVMAAGRRWAWTVMATGRRAVMVTATGRVMSKAAEVALRLIILLLLGQRLAGGRGAQQRDGQRCELHGGGRA